ncbi:MAG: hypothetical protein LUG24_07255 [Clostridiales bacterium]|nr:hypothetical protein [Clostridiales bacterium]
MKFADAITGLTFAVGNNCTASVSITTGTSGGAATVTNTDSNVTVTDLTALETGNYSITRNGRLYIATLEITVTAVESDTVYVYFGVSDEKAKAYDSYTIVDANGDAVTDTNGNAVTGDTVYEGVEINGVEHSVSELAGQLQGTGGSDYVIAFIVNGATGGDSSTLDISFE